jgi:hypothetical protein
VGKILICACIDVFDKNLPLYDHDNDGFTDVGGFRRNRMKRERLQSLR